ncbi:hypothetical protein GCM10009809_27050 [Isoptericola hypogeus]|uniref:PepSY domain-containing protein n=1 Tax=Isoptericola hypogeus TaxID=300179 RepID=A0ABN2JK46_9MICO
MILACAALSVAGTLVLSSCTTGGPTSVATVSSAPPAPPAPPASLDRLDEARRDWERAGMQDYTFVVDSGCGERNLIGRFAVTVRDGVVSAVTGEIAGEAITPDEYLDEGGETIDGFLDRVSTASPEDVVALELDDALGYPTVIGFDPEPRGIDDEECYEIGDVEVTP